MIRASYNCSVSPPPQFASNGTRELSCARAMIRDRLLGVINLPAMKDASYDTLFYPEIDTPPPNLWAGIQISSPFVSIFRQISGVNLKILQKTLIRHPPPPLKQGIRYSSEIHNPVPLPALNSRLSKIDTPHPLILRRNSHNYPQDITILRILHYMYI